MKKCGVIIGLRPTNRSIPFLTEVMNLLGRMQFKEGQFPKLYEVPGSKEGRFIDRLVISIFSLRTAFPNLYYEELEIIASENEVISTLIVTGEHLGNFFVIPPTGRKIAYQAIQIPRIGNDGTQGNSR